MNNLPLGYAAAWLPDRKNTWSGTTWGMLTALRRLTDVADIDLSLSKKATLVMKLRFAGYNPTLKKVTSEFIATPEYNRMLSRKLNRALAQTPVRAVLSIGSPITRTAPLFIYQDMILSKVLWLREAGIDLPEYRHLSSRQLTRLSVYIRKALDACAGVITMSEWDRSFLIDQQYLPPERVYISPPGINVLPAEKKSFTDDGINRVLFVGKEFFRKGGLETLGACEMLHRGGHKIELTIAGPTSWPLETPIPPFVRFLGLVSFGDLPREFARANTFCMPSRYEPFGIVFPEALSAGLPCIAMNMNAAPEIIQHGMTGILLDRCEPESIAAAIAECYTNPSYRELVAGRAEQYRSYYSWESSARRVLQYIDGAVLDSSTISPRP